MYLVLQLTRSCGSCAGAAAAPMTVFIEARVFMNLQGKFTIGTSGMRVLGVDDQVGVASTICQFLACLCQARLAACVEV